MPAVLKHRRGGAHDGERSVHVEPFSPVVTTRTVAKNDGAGDAEEARRRPRLPLELPAPTNPVMTTRAASASPRPAAMLLRRIVRPAVESSATSEDGSDELATSHVSLTPLPKPAPLPPSPEDCGAV